jgi:hypothetical protein
VSGKGNIPIEVEVHSLPVQQRLGKVPTHKTVVPAREPNRERAAT